MNRFEMIDKKEELTKKKICECFAMLKRIEKFILGNYTRVAFEIKQTLIERKQLTSNKRLNIRAAIITNANFDIFAKLYPQIFPKSKYTPMQN